MKIPVRSSQIASVEYDQGAKQLTIEFKNGSNYQYDYCTPEVFKTFMESPSKGEYFSRNIKNVLPWKKL